MSKRGVTSPLFIILIALAAVLLAMAVDRPVTLFFQHYKRAAYNDFFRFITHFGDALYYIVVGTPLYLLLRKRYKALAKKIGYLFLTVAVSGIVVDILKIIFGRSRPKLFINDTVYGFEFFRLDSEYFSFPSGHSATAFGLATALSYFFPRFRIPLFLFGAVVAMSRLTVVAHYLSDIIAGGLVGVLTAIVLRRVMFKESGAGVDTTK